MARRRKPIDIQDRVANLEVQVAGILAILKRWGRRDVQALEKQASEARDEADAIARVLRRRRGV